MLTDLKAIISALYENYNNKSYQSRLARWADRFLPFDFEVILVPGVTLGIVDYLSRYPTFPAPELSRYDELFVVKSFEAFHQAPTFITSYNSSKLRDICCPPSQEGAQFSSQDDVVSSLRHSPVDFLTFLPNEGVDLSSQEINQSETGMQIDNRRPVYVSKIPCLRPESLRNSHLTQSSSIAYLKSTVMSQPPGTNQTTTDLNSTPTQHDSQTLVNSTAEKADLLTFVESFPLNSPNFRRPSPGPPMRFRQLSRISRLHQIRQRYRTRERATKTRFVAAGTKTRKDSHSQLLEAMRRCRLSKPGKNNTAARIGVLAVNGGKPPLPSSKNEIMALSGLSAELTEEDRFLGPMKRDIINKYITSFIKLGSYMA